VILMLWTRLSDTKKRRRGVVAVVVAMSMTMILGFVALVLDGGLLLDNHRSTQAAADAAALAAASDLYQHYGSNNGNDPSGTAAASALSTAAADGYTNDGTTSVVQVNIPPVSGSFSGRPGYAEVIVQYNQPRNFSAIWGSGAMPVSGRAVARGLWTAFGNGIILLDPTKKGSLDMTGNGNLTLNGASIIVDSDNQQAIVDTGNGNATTPEFLITGSPGDVVTGKGKLIGVVDSGVNPTPDPLSYIPEPDPSSLAIAHSGNTLNISSVPSQGMTLSPGVYTNGTSISAPGPGTITMQPGIYYMAGGGFRSSGSANIVGNGVLIYNAPVSSGDVISITGPGSVTITPPTSGIYQGISIFQDRTSSAPVSVTGNGSMNISGTFYAAHATLNITGNGSTNVIGSQYITYDLNVTGNGGININWSVNQTARSRVIGLVE
jgi:Putative Flp pilus-assembly TadE/G-like